MFEPDDDQRALRDGLARWSKDLSENHQADDASATFPVARWDVVRRTGLLSLPFDPRWGGLGMDLPTTLYLLEGLGEHCRDGGLSFSTCTSMVSTGLALQAFGSPELQDRWLPAIIAGDAIGAHAISESGAGSDALAMSTRADRDGDHFVLRGAKAFCTNAPIADVIVVYARTRPEGGPLGITAFLVERDTPGLEIGKAAGKMGLRTSPLAEVFLDDCRVPASHVVGRVGGGFLVLDHVMKREILCSFAVNVGEMGHRLERCIDHARTRSQFGQTIGSFQAVAHRIVNMKVRLETARKWLFDTAVRLERGDNVTVDVAITKLLISEANVESALSAVQLFGGGGYLTELGLEKDVRDAVAGTIYSGTTEIQYNRIASMLGLTGRP